MKIVLFATSNNGKIISAKRTLEQFDISVEQVNVDLVEPREYDVTKVCNGKIIQAFNITNSPTIVHDGSFVIPSLNGFPGTFVNHMLETIGIEGLLKLVDGKDRSCSFVECVGYMEPSMKSPKFFTWSIEGTVSEQEHGKFEKWHLSRLSTIFIPNCYMKTLAEFSESEYDEFRRSLKGHHFQQLGEWLSGR